MAAGLFLPAVAQAPEKKTTVVPVAPPAQVFAPGESGRRVISLNRRQSGEERPGKKVSAGHTMASTAAGAKNRWLCSPVMVGSTQVSNPAAVRSPRQPNW